MDSDMGASRLIAASLIAAVKRMQTLAQVAIIAAFVALDQAAAMPARLPISCAAT
jgi:hypothetical protein